MTMRKLLYGTALSTALLVSGGLPAAATPTINFGGYTGSVTLKFFNYESFKTTGGAITSTPTVGAENFGILYLNSIVAGKKTLWYSGKDGQQIAGVFNGITVKSVTNPGTVNEKTTNTGGVFKLYLVPSAQFTDLGLAGYTSGGCSSVAGLCYDGITNGAAQALVTMTLVPGITADPTVTLSALVDGTVNPATGSASFDALFSGNSQLLPDVSGHDSFCSNETSSGCAGADNSSFAIASSDPLHATVVPEPPSLWLFGSGLLLLGWFAGWRRRKRKPDRVAV